MRRRLRRHDGENAGSAKVSKLVGQSAAFAVASFFGATAAAVAADLPLPVTTPPPISAVYNWTGLYVAATSAPAGAG